jgi:hypothetical protein
MSSAGGEVQATQSRENNMSYYFILAMNTTAPRQQSNANNPKNEIRDHEIEQLRERMKGWYHFSETSLVEGRLPER